MNDIEIEVVDAPVFELLFADRLNTVMVVEGVPELGDEEEIFALDDALFDSTSNTLARLDFVTVVCRVIQNQTPGLVPEIRN